MQMKDKQLAFRLRMQFGLKSKLGGFCEEDVPALADDGQPAQVPKWRNLISLILKHDTCADALLDSAVASNLVACREPERHFECHNGTDLSVCPDGIVNL